MKKLFLSCAVVFLSGCATIDQVRELWPRPHDSSLVGAFVDLQQKMELVNCSDKHTIYEAINKADWLNKYAFFRQDPQKITTNTILQNLNKASSSEKVACERWINLVNINLKTIQKSWGSR